MQNKKTIEIFDSIPTRNRGQLATTHTTNQNDLYLYAPVEYNPEEMIKDGHIPKHENSFNWHEEIQLDISAQYAQKIENWKLTDLKRDAIISGIAPEFRVSWSCGKDFTIRPITNCGKGDPMQSMIMGNSGPKLEELQQWKRWTDE